MRFPFHKSLNRINGISTPILGIQWVPPVLESSIVTHLFTFMEDRRVLYNIYEGEIPAHCTESVIKIRERLTEDMQQIGPSSELEATLSSMRASCRCLLDKVNKLDNEFKYRSGTGFDMEFFSALGQWRGIMGVHLAYLSAKYHIDVEQQLAGIFPPETRNDD